MKKILFLVFALFTTFTINSAHAYVLTQEAIEIEQFYMDQEYDKAQNSTQTVGKIKVSHGGLYLGVGSGNAYIDTDNSNNIKNLSIDVKVSIAGIINQRIKQSISISQLLSGSPLNFYMDGAKKPALKIVPSNGFTKKGGRAEIKILMKSGYVTEYVSIAPNKYGTYKISKSSSTVDNININMRGLNPATMVVGWYELD